MLGVSRGHKAAALVRPAVAVGGSKEVVGGSASRDLMDISV